MLSIEDVKYTAGLARIKLEDKEIDKLVRQLHDILDFIDKLKEVNVEQISPTSYILPINTVVREDIPKESLPIVKTLKNAPLKEETFFKVPKVIE